jgi:hypothetical protein
MFSVRRSNRDFVSLRLKISSSNRLTDRPPSTPLRRGELQGKNTAMSIQKLGRTLSLLFVTVIVLASANRCAYLQSAPPNGRISVQAVSWKLVKKLAEPDAGLIGHKITILANRRVIASGTTGNSGLVEFDVPPGTYTLLGAGDEPQDVQVQSGQIVNFQLVVH